MVTESKNSTSRRKKFKTESEESPISLMDRLPPVNSEAEKNVVGAILLDPSLCDEVGLVLRPGDFYSEALRRIYQRLLDMNAEGTGIDLMLLLERLRENGELEEVGGELFLAEIMQSVQVAAHADEYAKIVRNQAIRRELIHAAASVLRDAYEPEVLPRELLGQAEQRIMAVGDARNVGQVCSLRDLMGTIMERINNPGGGQEGVTTGFGKLDELLGGLHKSELIILAARPSMGKTALATNIADYVAVMEKQPVLFMSLEMSRTELAIRMICARGRIRGDKFRTCYFTHKELQTISVVSAALSNAPFYLDDTPSRTVTEIASVARRIKRQEGLGLIVIDYLGLIEPDNPNDPRQEQVAKIARRLKGLARELDVPVLCLAQLNRMTEATKDNRPRLSHLRESGAIEQDADVVMFVHREEYYHNSESADDKQIKGLAEVIIAKQRNGPIGEVKLAWQSEFTLFSNLALDDPSGVYEDDFSNQGDMNSVNSMGAF